MGHYRHVQGKIGVVVAGKKVNISVDEELAKRIEAYGKKRGMRRSKAAAELIEMALDGDYAPEHVATLRTNLRRSYELFDNIMDTIKASGYKHH